MENKEVLKRLLKPVDSRNDGKWEEFLNTVDENISWYPSAGSDFRDILFLNNPVFNHTDFIPSVYIHTEISFAHDLILNQQVQNLNGIDVIINNIIELQTDINLNCNDADVTQPAGEGGIKHLEGRKLFGAMKKQYLQMKEFEENSSRVYLLNVSTEFNNIRYENKNILYFFFENYCFFERFVLDQNLLLSLIFCHCSQSFDLRGFENLLNNYSGIEFLISDPNTFSSMEEFQNEIINVNANLSLHCINTINTEPFERQMKTFQVNRTME